MLQQFDDSQMPIPDGPRERRLATFALRLNTGTLLEQHLDDRLMPHLIVFRNCGIQLIEMLRFRRRLRIAAGLLLSQMNMICLREISTL